MTACCVGETDADVRERVGRFLATSGRDDDAGSFIAERRDRWLLGTVEEVAARIEGLRGLGVTRVLLQHLNHDDDAMVTLIGDRLLPQLR
jgi:alkanesulfonate monooxygenase SsuD/methylene tetrahydromethanopterin reductase-like flavin-dependent oxidoreductase (luciferase family)